VKTVLYKYLGYPLLGLVGLFFVLGVIGGGWGDKPPLPAPFVDAPRPLLLAHRGVTRSYPENSLGAVEDARRLGFPGIEVDLQYSADSAFIAFHDSNTQRMIGRAGLASELTVAELDRNHLLLDGRETNQTVPTLEGIVDSCNGRLLFYFDMKRFGHNSNIDLARDIAAFIDRHDLYDRAIVASAKVWFIAWIEFNYPRIVTALEGIDPRGPWLYSLLPKRFKTDLVSSRYTTVTPDMLRWLQETGMNKRYISYHVGRDDFDPAVQSGIEMFIIDYDSHLDSFLNPGL